MIGHAAEVDYQEGIYVGYRGYDKNKIVPAYEFGYGLSYTSFKISNLSLGAKTFKDKMKVTVDVTNTGQVAGKEVIQLYLSAPSKSMDKPVQELKGFAKTLLLAPNQTQKVTFELNARDLASFDEKTSTWIAESGNYTINIGASSRNIQQKGDFKLSKSINVEKVTKALAKQ
jgi:beta-glucosidase